MGNLITAHVTLQEPSANDLASIPKSIGFRIYHHRAAKLFLIDAFPASKPPKWPFTARLPATDMPLELPPDLTALESLNRFLLKRGLADYFKTSYSNVSLLLNRLLKSPVFSFASNDDGLDFACVASREHVERLEFTCEDLHVTYANGTASIQPLVPEFEEDDGLTDVDELRKALPLLTVLDRDVPWDSRLHSVAIDNYLSFAKTSDLILGLGSFDPPEDEAEWTLLGESSK
ncbi:MAG: hypothetical protein ACK5T6_00775 [Pirellula sp.]